MIGIKELVNVNKEVGSEADGESSQFQRIGDAVSEEHEQSGVNLS